MPDTSERIIILSAVILVVIIGQFVKMYKTEPIKEDTILTWRDMQIQIATSRDNYTLGEGFTATVYLVNNRSEEVQMQPITSLSIEGGRDMGYSGLASTHDWTPAAGTVTTLPAYSKKKLADQYFTPEKTGEFIITSLGVNKTVLILEPNIQPYDNTASSNGTITASGPLGDLSKLNLTMKCDLPSALEYVPRLKIERTPITNRVAEEIALNAFNFSDIEKIEITSMGNLAVVEGNKRLDFFGLNDIYYQTLGDKTVVEEWSEPEIRAIADEFLENLYNYWQVPTEAHIEFDTIKPSSVTVYQDGTEDVRKIGAKYSVKMADIKLYGPGADFGLSIADGKVYDVELHIPSIFVEEYTDLPLSPQEALDRFLAGNYSIEELGFWPLYGPIPREGQLTVEKVELVYFIDYLSDPPQTYPPLCYMISGAIIGPAPFGDEIIRIDFNELIPVT